MLPNFNHSSKIARSQPEKVGPYLLKEIKNLLDLEKKYSYLKGSKKYQFITEEFNLIHDTRQRSATAIERALIKNREQWTKTFAENFSEEIEEEKIIKKITIDPALSPSNNTTLFGFSNEKSTNNLLFFKNDLEEKVTTNRNGSVKNFN